MKKDKRILISVISPGFNLLNRYSAVASVIYSFASLLKNEGYDIYVNDKSLSNWNEEISNNNNNIGKSTNKLYKLMPKRIREIIKDVIAYFENKKLVKAISNNPRPDLIISWVTIRNSSIVDLSKNWEVPIISIYDNPLSDEYKYLHGFYPFFKINIECHEKKMIQNSDVLILYSAAVKEYLEKKFLFGANVYYKAFTDFKRMNYLKKDSVSDFNVINFAYIGSFFNWHNIDDLIEVFNDLNKDFPHSRLYLIGDGPEYNRIHSLVTNPNIILTGKMDGADLEKLMSKLHVGVISNSLWFHAPVKFFQYSASGLVVIAKKTPTIYELSKDGKSYLFFETKDEMKLQMLKVLKSPELIGKLGSEVSSFVKNNYSENNYSLFFDKVINEVLKIKN